ncbi:hypothetical protein KEM54_005465 [Ascosphaera aggregata]|nr:hypothetical protein KEM54_005465 [Ascosphaera aggregata]
MSLGLETLGETIAVFDKSGEVVSTTKHLYNVFKEAQDAYKKARSGLVDQYNATFNQCLEAERLQPNHRQLSWDDNESIDFARPHASPGERRHNQHKRSQSLDRTISSDYSNSRSNTHRLDLVDESLKTPLMQHENGSVFLSPLDSEEDGIDTDLAYGEYHAETFEQIHRNAEEDMKKLMSKTQQMLIEAKCAEASAVATINHLQSNPEAMAAIALTLAEVSKLAKSVGPQILNAVKVAFPSAFALLACPQFLVASSVGIGITIVMIGGYKIIKQIRAACHDDENEPRFIEDKKSFPSHLVDDFAPPLSPWSPPPLSLHSPTAFGDAQWEGIPRMASRLTSRPSVDRSEMYELESRITGVNSWLKALDTDGSRSQNKPERELMTPHAACESGFILDKAGQMHPPPRRRHTSDRDERPTRVAASPGTRAAYADSGYSISTAASSSSSSSSSFSSSSSSSRGSPTNTSYERAHYSRRYDSGIDLNEEDLYTKDGKPVKVRKSRGPSERREPTVEEFDDDHSRARPTRESRPRVTRSRHSHSTERRSRSRRPEPPAFTNSMTEALDLAPPMPDRSTRTIRRVRSISSPPEGLAKVTSLSPRQPNEVPAFSQPFVEPNQPSSHVKGSRTAKVMGILTLGISNRESRASRQSQHGSWRRSKSAADENRAKLRSDTRRPSDGGPPDDYISKASTKILQKQVQEKTRGGPAAAQAWFEKRGKHERRSSKLNPLNSKGPCK